MFDCFKLHSKCKAMCCKCAPIEKEIYERNKHRLIQIPDDVFEFEGFDKLDETVRALIIPTTKDGFCPFLQKDYKCAIYDDRPSVCQKFGNEKDPNLRCLFQDKNGRVRNRAESRQMLRDAEKATAKLLSNSGQFLNLEN